MSRQTLVIVVLCFMAGGAVMIGIRGAGILKQEAPGINEANAETEAPAASPTAHAEHAQHPAPAAKEHAHPAGASTKTKVYVCAQDSSYGLSYAGPCPLDGAPMVERELDMSTVEDIENPKCPIMGGKARADVFALYKNKKVRFCCPGCGAGFFADPDGHLAKLGGKPKSAPLKRAAAHGANQAHQMTKVYLCAQDPSIGLSYADACPLDGKPMVERTVNLSDYQDLENPTCPVMGGKARKDVFALHSGKLVRFCCPGCGATFFGDPQGHFKKLNL